MADAYRMDGPQHRHAGASGGVLETLGAFSALGVEPKLNALIYGESILNDAVAIAAFRVFDSMDGDGFVSAATVGLG